MEAAVAERLEEDFLARYVAHWLPAAPLFAGVAETLRELRAQDLSIAICTNRDRASTERLLAAGGIADCVDVIVGIGDAAHAKPAPDPLLLALERLGVAPAHAVFVGDSSMDANCALRAGVRFAAHQAGYAGQPSDLLPNVFAFSDYEQFARWILDQMTATKEACYA